MRIVQHQHIASRLGQQDGHALRYVVRHLVVLQLLQRHCHVGVTVLDLYAWLRNSLLVACSLIDVIVFYELFQGHCRSSDEWLCELTGGSAAGGGEVVLQIDR